MFNFFKSKPAGIKTKDIIWMSEAAKWNGILETSKKEPSLVIICWFDATMQQAENLFADQTGKPELLMARQVHPSHTTGRKVIFAEHYPLRSKEQDLFERLSLREVIIHSALEEPLFARFGGAKVIQLMKQLGMKESEPAEHKMISQSIVSAQEKIGKKITIEHSAGSQKEWMERNLTE
jgi:hypothetical protein